LLLSVCRPSLSLALFDELISTSVSGLSLIVVLGSEALPGGWCLHELKGDQKIPHRNRSQVQVSLKVTAQIDHLNITVTLAFFKMFDIFSIDSALVCIPCLFVGGSSYIPK